MLIFKPDKNKILIKIQVGKTAKIWVTIVWLLKPAGKNWCVNTVKKGNEFVLQNIPAVVAL